MNPNDWGLLALVMFVKSMFLFYFLGLLPSYAVAQTLQLSAGGAAYRFLNSHDGHITNTATGGFGWDMELRYTGFRKDHRKGCIGLQVYNLNTHFYYNYWAGGGAYSEWIKGDLSSVNLGFCWYPLNFAKKKKTLEWRAGIALNIPLISKITGRWYEHDYYSTPPYKHEGEFTEKEKKQAAVPFTFNLISTMDLNLFHAGKIKYKLRFKAAINPLFEVLSIGSYRGSASFVASMPISSNPLSP